MVVILFLGFLAVVAAVAVVFLDFAAGLDLAGLLVCSSSATTGFEVLAVFFLDDGSFFGAMMM
jgi:hypothetical protein